MLQKSHMRMVVPTEIFAQIYFALIARKQFDIWTEYSSKFLAFHQLKELSFLLKNESKLYIIVYSSH